jgi:hypothetical protein
MDTTPEGFTGAAADLLEALNAVATETQQKAKGWPKTPPVLAKILRRLAPPLRKIGINVAFDRENRRRWMTIVPVKVDETPSQPSPPSFSNSLNDLEETASRHHAVTDEEVAVTGDGSGSTGDSDNLGTVTSNPLKNKEGDGGDGGDGIFPNLSGSHVCAQCHGPSDGKERPVAYCDQTIWLHPECERFFIKAQGARAGHP